MTRRRSPNRNASRTGSSMREWVGGRLPTPFEIAGPPSYRPDLVLWVALPEHLILYNDVVEPDVPSDLAASLRETMARLDEPGGSPGRVRVASASDAAAIRAAFGPRLEVVVAPTPELDAILAEMQRGLRPASDRRSYLRGRRIAPEVVARLFEAASQLWQVAPWQDADDDALFQVDIPRLGVEGAVLSIIGALGESFGFILFPSLEAYDRFAEFEPPDDPAGLGADIDFGSDHLSLELVEAEWLSPAMQREITRHGWSVASPEAHPVVARRSRHGEAMPLTEADVRIASACARAIVSFWIQHMDASGMSETGLGRQRSEVEPGLEVMLTFLAAPDDIDDPEPLAPFAEPAPPPRKTLGRNDPCHCGSGRKYKKCCLGADEATPRAEPPLHPTHTLDGLLVRELAGWAQRRFGSAALEAAVASLEMGEEHMLLIPWVTYCMPIQGRTIAEHFLAQPGRRLAADERAWLEAQRESWLSIWECVGTEPGSHVVLADLLTGEQRTVIDRAASKTLSHRQALLARVVDHGGESFLVGAHSRTLPPREAAEVVRKVRARLRRQGEIPCERLRDPAVSHHLFACWEAELEKSETRSRAPVQLQNTDGDPFLLTVDHFVFESGARDAVAARISALDDVELEEPAENGDLRYAFLRKGNAIHASRDNTVLGHSTLSARGLRVETNSVTRSDALRVRIEAACAPLLRHRAREHADPQSPAVQRSAAARPEREAPAPPEAQQLMLEFKTRHYADWADHPLPALQGRTPREAVRTAPGRKDVDLLLKDMESHEAQSPPGEAFNFSQIRRALGLEA